MNQDELYKTAFAKVVVEDSVALAQESMAKKKDAPPLDSKGQYIHLTSSSLTEVTKTLENLEYCEIFLDSYSVSVKWKKKYDRSHYVRYHYEAWIINLIRLYERLLILLNDVYDLGIAHKEVTYIKVSASPHLAGTKTLKLLNKIHGALSQVQGLKNEVFHRYAYSDSALDDISMYDFLARQSQETIDSSRFKWAAKFKMNIYLTSKKQEVKKNNKVMLEIVVAVLKTLDTEYKQRKETFSPQTN
jgi:hypothetical protein